jgi:hypothetical protein
MSPGARSTNAARRSCGTMSSCPAVWGILVQNPSRPPGRAIGRLACLGSPSIQPGGARVPRANAQTLGSGHATRCAELDSDLLLRRPEAALGTPPYCTTRETHRVESQRMDHLMQQPRPIMQQRRTRPLPTTSAFRAKNPPTTHARATLPVSSPGGLGWCCQGALQSGPTGWPVSAWVVGSSR